MRTVTMFRALPLSLLVLVIAGVSLVKAMVFSWLDMALLRIMPAYAVE